MDYRLLSLLALACWGVWGYLSKVLTRTTEPRALAFWATLASLVPITLFAVSRGVGRWARPTPGVIAAGLLAGVATVAFYLALRRGPASVVMPLTGMYILIPAVLGFVVLKEPVTVTHVLGLACAGLAVLLLSL
jgi:bacterial/archaeal transporter family protein